MQIIPSGVAALAVTAIFYIWRSYAYLIWRRERMLRERVAYMLWCVAQEVS